MCQRARVRPSRLVSRGNDRYKRVHQASRSAAVRRAVGLLRLSELSSDYAAAFDEWADHGHNEAWDTTVADGV